jgi:MFS family permease
MGGYQAVCTFSLIISSFLFSPVIDLHSKRTLLSVSNAARGFFTLFAGILIMLVNGNNVSLLLIYSTAVVVNACAAIFNSVSTSTIPLIVDLQYFAKANGYFGVVDNLTSIIGFSVGVLIYQCVGIKVILISNGICYLIAAIITAFLRVRNNKPQTTNKFQMMTDGLKYIKKIQVLPFFILFAFFWNLIYTAVYSVYIPFSFNRVYKMGLPAFSIIEVADMLGMIIGSFLAANIKSKLLPIKLLIKVVVVQLPFFILLPILNFFFLRTHTPDVIIVATFTTLFFFMAVTVAFVNVYLNTSIQRETEESYLGRVNLLKTMFALSAAPISSALGGILLQNISITSAYGLSAFLFLIFTIIISLKGKSLVMQNS